MMSKKKRQQTLESADGKETPIPQEAKGERKSGWLKSLGEIAAAFSALIVVVSMISAVLVRSASWGRILFYQFDMDYFDFAATSGDTVLFWTFALCTTYSVLVSGFACLFNLGWIEAFRHSVLDKHIKRPFFRNAILLVLHILAALVYLLLFIYLTEWLLGLLVPPQGIAKPLFTISLIFAIVTYTILQMSFHITERPLPNKFGLLCTLAILLLMLLVVVGSIIQTAYNAAEEQTDFPIIVEEAQETPTYYVVINTGKEMYSAYEASIDAQNEILTIKAYKHKYFNKHTTPTQMVQFAEVVVEDLVLEANRFAQ